MFKVKCIVIVINANIIINRFQVNRQHFTDQCRFTDTAKVVDNQQIKLVGRDQNRAKK